MKPDTTECLASAWDQLKAENAALKHRCDMLTDEKSKLGLMYDKLLKEKSDLDRKIGFLEGQIEAYQFCVNIRR
jgi:predicted nuclease with TOPRIM domain